MTLYLDSSALIKRYLEEPDSDVVLSAMDEVESWWCCRVGFVETARAVGRAAGAAAIATVESEWTSFEVVEVDQSLSMRAAQLAVSSELRSLDAMHLAAAMELPEADLTFATWDRRLHRAAREHGLRTLPATLVGAGPRRECLSDLTRAAASSSRPRGPVRPGRASAAPAVRRACG